MGSGFSKMKKQQKLMQEQMAQMQDKMKDTEYTGSSASDLVKVTIDGEKNLKSLSINPECVDPEDIEGLEDLIKQAFENAIQSMADSPDNPMANLPFSL